MATYEERVASTATEVLLAEERHIPKRAVGGWVLYDLANTIFSMGVVSTFFPLFVRAEVGGGRADFIVMLVTAVSMSVIFLVSPLLGAMTDRAPRRMPFLIMSTLLCVCLTILLARGGFIWAAVCFALANIAYQAGLQFYDALLPEVSTEGNRGKIGGIGVGVGYLGSFMAVGLGFVLSVSEQPALLFTAIALLFLGFSLPCFLFVRERGNPAPRPINLQMVSESTRETIRTLKQSQRYPGLLRFLVGRVFYTDAINTVINAMMLFAVNVAENADVAGETARHQQQAYVVMLTAIAFAVIGGFAWGAMADRIGPKRTLNRVLICWMAIFAFASCVGFFGLPVWALYVVSCSAGLSLGGIWAADRPYMLRLTPPSRIGEFYGLYGMVGRFSAIVGPLLWLGMMFLAVKVMGLTPLRGQGLAILVLLTLVVISFAILQRVTDEPRAWTGSDLLREG